MDYTFGPRVSGRRQRYMARRPVVRILNEGGGPARLPEPLAAVETLAINALRPVTE